MDWAEDFRPGPVDGELLISSCGVQVHELAAYQAVKISLMPSPQPRRGAELVRGRPAFVRLFVRPGPVAVDQESIWRLTVRSAHGTLVLEDRKRVQRPSTDADLDSTFNFEIPPLAMADHLRLTIEDVTPEPCLVPDQPRARLPQAGELEITSRKTGTLRLVLVPIRYEADGSGKLPELTDDLLSRMHDAFTTMFPVEAVELTVREPVRMVQPLTERTWGDLLDAVRELRAADAPPADVYYYGMVAPAANFSEYCRGVCTAGLAFRPGPRTSALRVGLGVGFDEPRTIEIAAHEIGHLHGLGHAPCGTDVDLDPRFPYREGSIGVWGFDPTSRTMQNPSSLKDMMGYCRSRWISDYSYQAILTRSVAVNLPVHTGALVIEDGSRWHDRTLLVDGEGQTRWAGASTGLDGSSGQAEDAVVQDVNGTPVATVQVSRIALDHGAGALYLVPVRQPGWERIVVGDGHVLSFDAPGTPLLLQ